MSIEKTGTIEKFGQSTNGKPKVLIEGSWYFLGKTDMSSATVGDRISFEANAFGKEGNLWGINKWGKMPNGGTVMASVTSAPRPAVSDEAVLRFVSNCVGSAIHAGTISEPEAIEKWVVGAKAAYRAQFGGE